MLAGEIDGGEGSGSDESVKIVGGIEERFCWKIFYKAFRELEICWFYDMKRRGKRCM